MCWKPITQADTSPAVGMRSAIIIGCDNDGNIHRTAYANSHPKGECWLILGEEYLMEWTPILFVEEPLLMKRS